MDVLFGQHGEQWKRDACTTCACHRGEVRCVRETCAAVTCDKVVENHSCATLPAPERSSGPAQRPLVFAQGQSKARRPGSCCQECVSAAESCLYNGTASYHGQMWNSTRCDFCMCHQGQVTCQPAECAKVECAQVRRVFFFQDVSIKPSWFFSPLVFLDQHLETLREPVLRLGLGLCNSRQNTWQERGVNFRFPMRGCLLSSLALWSNPVGISNQLTLDSPALLSAHCRGGSATQLSVAAALPGAKLGETWTGQR